MDINEFIEQNELSEDVGNKLTEFYNNQIEAEKTQLQEQFKSTATENAEKILEGASKKVQELTGIEREKGQKVAEYIAFASENYFKGTKESLSKKERELEDKIKNGKVDETLKQELQETKDKLTKLKEKEAQFADWEENDYKGQLQEKNQQFNRLMEEVAFSKVKPRFPEKVNKFEAAAKWGDFIKGVKEKYDIRFEDNDPSKEVLLKDKENEFKTYKLQDLVEKDETIQELLKDRKITGIGSTAKKIKVDGIPFEIPENATGADRAAAIRDYLTSVKKLPVTSREYAQEFAKLNSKLQETA